MPKTKIIATLGPASSSLSVISKLALNGMDIARLNFSHGSHAEHLSKISVIRAFNKKYRRHIRILADLEGHRIRTGKLAGSKSIFLEKREKIKLAKLDTHGTTKKISIDYSGDFSVFKKNNRIFIDDGKIFLKVLQSKPGETLCEVVIGGELQDRKGLNAPDTKLIFNTLNTKDRSDIDFIIEHKPDYIAQSFVRSAKDIDDIRLYMGEAIGQTKLIAKIENLDGIQNLDKILKSADGIMIARGDMGVSLPVYQVPIMQKRIIQKCKKSRKFSITATQMLDSMTHNSIPTRAEVSDVANAILDGSDFVMLSAETAAGSYPAQSVKMMNDIIIFTEKSKEYKTRFLCPASGMTN